MRSTNEPCDCEIALRSRKPCPEKAAHERARKYLKMCRQCTDSRYACTWAKERLEKTPAIRGHADQVEGQLAERKAFNGCSTFSYQCLTELSPSAGRPNIDESLETRTSEIQHVARCGWLDLRKQRNGWNTRKLANELSDLRCLGSTAARD